MYEKSCASSNHIKSWKDIDFGNITRFTRIKAEANPYDEIWMEYFAERKNKSYSNFKFVYE